MQRTLQAARIGDIGVWALANIAYGAAHSGRGQQIGALFTVLARVAKRLVADFNARDLANTA